VRRVPCFLPENHALVKEALTDRGRQDLIGQGRDCLIPDRPPPTARKRTPARGSPTVGYRHGRKGARRGG